MCVASIAVTLVYVGLFSSHPLGTTVLPPTTDTTSINNKTAIDTLECQPWCSSMKNCRKKKNWKYQEWHACNIVQTCQCLRWIIVTLWGFVVCSTENLQVGGLFWCVCSSQFQQWNCLHAFLYSKHWQTIGHMQPVKPKEILGLKKKISQRLYSIPFGNILAIILIQR